MSTNFQGSSIPHSPLSARFNAKMYTLINILRKNKLDKNNLAT